MASGRRIRRFTELIPNKVEVYLARLTERAHDFVRVLVRLDGVQRRRVQPLRPGAASEKVCKG